MAVLVMLMLALVCDLAASEATSEDQCKSLKPSDARLSLKIYKNITGHWITQVRLNHGPTAGQPVNEQLDVWDVHIEQTTLPCEAGEAVAVVATMSGAMDEIVLCSSCKLEMVVVAPPRRAGPGYELFPGIGYYKLHTDVLNWEQARAKCVEEGGHLAIINSEAESSVLQQLLAQYPQVTGSASQEYAFIGFHDRYTEGQYVTIFGTPLESTGFSRWSHPGQPDNYNSGPGKPGEDCGSVHRNGGLNDVTCSARLAFFCEQELWG